MLLVAYIVTGVGSVEPKVSVVYVRITLDEGGYDRTVGPPARMGHLRRVHHGTYGPVVCQKHIRVEGQKVAEPVLPAGVLVVCGCGGGGEGEKGRRGEGEKGRRTDGEKERRREGEKERRPRALLVIFNLVGVSP